MSVVEVLEIADGVNGGASLEQGAKFTRTFQVEFSSFNHSPVAAIDADDGTNAVPGYGQLHPDDLYVYVIDKNAEIVDGSNGLFWKVTVQYGRPSVSADPAASPSPPPDGTSGGSPASPITSTKIKWGTWTRTVAPTRDILLNVFQNSAGDLIDPPPTREEENLQIEYQRTQSSFNVTWLKRINNRINSAAFTIGGLSFPTGTLKCKVSASFPAGSASSGWEVSITIQHDPDGWDWNLLDAGYKFLSSGVQKPFMDGSVPSARPRLLNGSGAALGTGGTPVYLPFRKYYFADFTALGLDY